MLVLGQPQKRGLRVQIPWSLHVLPVHFYFFFFLHHPPQTDFSGNVSFSKLALSVSGCQWLGLVTSSGGATEEYGQGPGRQHGSHPKKDSGTPVLLLPFPKRSSHPCGISVSAQCFTQKRLKVAGRRT